MLDKKSVIKNFSDEEKDDVIKVYEAMELSYLRDIPTFTNFFCTPNIWTYFVQNFNNVKVETDGAFDESDRRIISFNNLYEINYPYKLLKITSNSKFLNIGHRDYLGSLMALGIERKKIGDLVVLQEYAVTPVYEEIVEYIISNLNSVNKVPVKVEVINSDDLPSVNYETETINIASLRLDNFVAKIAKISRGKAIDIIKQGKVQVDYSKNIDKSADIKENQKLTIKGIGKFKIGEIVGNTKSGRYKININKYV